MKTKLINFNPTFIALFIIIIWDALKNYLNLHSIALQFAFLLPAIFLCLIDKKNKWDFLSKPLSIWLIWIIYSLINTFYLNDTGLLLANPYVLASSIVIAFIFTLLISRNKSQTESLINLLIFAYFARLVISYIFEPGGLIGSDTRFGEEFNSNTIGFGALFIIVLIVIKKIQFSSIRKIDFIILLIAIFTVIITGSRKNLIAVAFLPIIYIFITRSRYTLKNIFKYMIVVLICGMALFWVLNNTYIGERLIDGYERTVEASESGAYNRMFDSRASYYILGWEIFKDHKLNGIGLTNYMSYYNIGYGRALHTEYMVQITEGGLIGTAIFIYFYLFILIQLINIRNQNDYYKRLSEMYIGVIFIMLFLFTGTWIYRTPMMWVLIALTIRFLFEVKSSNSNQYKIAASNL